MSGDIGFLPNVFDDMQNKNSGGGTSATGSDSWSAYSTIQTNTTNEVLMPGILSGVIQVEAETSLKATKNVKWGDGRKAELRQVTRERGMNEVESVPETGDSFNEEWLYLLFAGVTALVAAFKRNKPEETV